MGTPTSEFVGSDAHLQPLGTAMFQNKSSSSLANSFPTSVVLKAPLTNSTSSHNPTTEQKKAIATLKDHHPSDIIAWHTLSQSIEPGLRHRDWPGGLSIQEIRAISKLSCCSRENLLQWLQSANQKPPSDLRLSGSRIAPATSSPQTRRASFRSDLTSGHLSPVESIKAYSPHLSNNPYSALTAAHNPINPSQNFSTAKLHRKSALVRPPNPDHTYWCTVCDNHSYQHSDGWKKHEKEHEIKYVCMLNGLLETTDDGQKCVLCGALNPADSHRLVHNIGPCLEAADSPSFKRRYEMVVHLKDAHGIPNGGAIADKWRCGSSKKAWSCGFCIRLFSSIQDRLRHIGADHFGKGQSIRDWDFTKIIQGLLLQPGIQESWQQLLGSLDPFRLLEIKWNKFGSEELLYRLEMGPTGKETPQSLAQAAYDSTSTEYDWTLPDKAATAFATPPLQEHAVASGEAPGEWSSRQHQASQILRSQPTSGTQIACGAAAQSSPPAYLVPPLDYSPVWKPLASDTDRMSSTQPTTPFNGNFIPAEPSVYTPWSGYNITPDPALGDQETFYYKTDDRATWPAPPPPVINDETIGTTRKRPRISVSPPAQTFPRKTSRRTRPRKRVNREISGESETVASQGLDIDCGQREAYDDEDAQSDAGANRCLKNSLYK